MVDKTIKNLTCIGCPLGCQIEVLLENGMVVSVKGNTCVKGKKYAEKEVVNPMRTVTSSIPVSNRNIQLSVKTKDEIPKNKIFDCIKELKKLKTKAPIHCGDIVFNNVADTDVDIVATKTIL